MNAYSPETERAVLGTCLMQPQALAGVRTIIGHEQFHNPAHQFLFAAACEIADRGHLDAIILIARLREIDRLNTVGGEQYVLTLCEADAGRTGGEYHARDLYR